MAPKLRDGALGSRRYVNGIVGVYQMKPLDLAELVILLCCVNWMLLGINTEFKGACHACETFLVLNL